MRRTFLIGFALALVFAAGGCADNYDKVVKDSLATMNELTDICEKIKTAADVDKYRDDLEKIADRRKDLAKRLEKLGNPDQKTGEQLKEKYAADFKKAGERMQALDTMMRNPAIAEKMQDIFKDVDLRSIVGSRPVKGDSPRKPPS